jgi:HEAT repeat protein
LALLELEKRKDKGLYDLATLFYEDATERDENRAEAVRILAEHDGVKIAARFLKDGRGNEDVMPELVRLTMADQLAKMRDEATDKALLKLVGEGTPHEQRFVLRALRGVRDEKLAKNLLKEIAAGTKKGPPDKNDPKYNDERDLVLAMIETVATLGDESAKPELQKLASSGKDPAIVAAAMNAVGVLSKNDPAWLASIEAAAASPQAEVRNAALATLGKTGDKKFIPVLVKALDNDEWSTRYAALDALKDIRTPETIAALVGRIEKEEGLMQVRFADALWSLTGKPFRMSGAAWKSWWDKEGATFQPISLAELAKIEADEEMRRLKLTTKAATFFGIRIVSHRVIFILDVSGSMQIELDSEYVGRRGRPRIDVAKEELVKAIDGLDPEALFNVIVFSSDVDSWLEGGMAESATATARDQGKQFVQALGAAGATNLYDALRLAFADTNCDTIIVLSDGEPNAGEESDPAIIRERVKQWNEHRGVVIHTIAVGGTFHVLEWLAQDSGGNHKKFQ